MVKLSGGSMGKGTRSVPKVRTGEPEQAAGREPHLSCADPDKAFQRDAQRCTQRARLEGKGSHTLTRGAH